MDQETPEIPRRVALFGIAPSIQQLTRGQYPFTARSINPGQAETFDLELPNTVGHTLLVGRIALRESTTDSWAVYGEREGHTLRPDKITEYVFGSREGVVGRVLWQREAEREQQAGTLAGAQATTPRQRRREWQME